LQALCCVIGLRICADVCGQVVDLLLRVNQLIGKQVQGFACRSGQIDPVTCCDQTFDIMDAPGHDDAELARMCARHAGGVLSARRIHDPGLLAHQKFPRTKNSRALWIINSACVSSLFTGTNRIEGRDTASQIASASA